MLQHAPESWDYFWSFYHPANRFTYWRRWKILSGKNVLYLDRLIIYISIWETWWNPFCCFKGNSCFPTRGLWVWVLLVLRQPSPIYPLLGPRWWTLSHCDTVFTEASPFQEEEEKSSLPERDWVSARAQTQVTLKCPKCTTGNATRV